MKRLIILFAVAAVVLIGTGVLADTAQDSGAAPLSASLSPIVTWNVTGWVILYIPSSDMAVDLGTIDGTLYDPVSGTWTPLTSSDKNVYVISNTSYILTVSAASTGNETADLSRFQIKGGDLATFTSLDSDQTLKNGGAGITHIADIQYQYIPSFADVPGDYAVTVTYTATAQ